MESKRKAIQQMWNDRPFRKEEEEEEQYVLGIDGGESPPFMMKGRINKNNFCLMIDSGSPVTIIGYDELQKIQQYDVLFLQPLPRDEKYVDFNKRPEDFLGYIFCELEVGNKYIRKARILVSRSGEKSIIGRDWLNYVQYSIEPKKGGKLNTVNHKYKESERAQERWKIAVIEQFTNLSERRDRI